MVTFTLSQRVWVFPKLRAIRAIRVSLAYVLTCKTCVNFSFLRTNVPIKAKKLLLRMERGHKINHIYIHNIYIYIYIYIYILYHIYIYPHTHVLSFPGLISVARVNKQYRVSIIEYTYKYIYSIQLYKYIYIIEDNIYTIRYKSDTIRYHRLKNKYCRLSDDWVTPKKHSEIVYRCC